MRNGIALVFATVLAGLLLALSVFLAKIVYNEQATIALLVEREQAYWLARGGLNWAKVQLAHNPDWHGEAEATLGEGKYRVAREWGKDGFSSTGYKGKAVYVLEGEIK